MTPEFQFLPPQASTLSSEVDALFFFVLGISIVFSGLIFLAVVFFSIRYRRKSDSDAPEQIDGSLLLELTWTIVPFLICLVMFAWGAKIFFENSRPPVAAEGIDILVTGKQWMLKVQHPDGTREINELHIPIGRPITLTMTSEDVIHNFFIPAFRTKMDVLPGRYTSLWFEATEEGKFHLFCAEYCGTKHSEMIGWVHVMQPHDYESWLGGGSGGESAVAAGERLFSELGCVSCHSGESGSRGPDLKGLYGKTEELASGGSVKVDDTYLRESILSPLSKVTEGFEPIMPTYQGLVDEMGIMRLIAYVKSLGDLEGAEGE